MMKRKGKSGAALSAIVLITALVLAGCDTGTGGVTGGGKIPAKFNFSGATPDPSPSLNIVPSRYVAGGGILESLIPIVDSVSFEHYTTAYGTLGTKLQSITPEKAKMLIGSLTLVGENGNLIVPLVSGESPVPDFDFADPVTLTLGEIPSGHYDMLLFQIQPGEMTRHGTKYRSEIRFTWPDGYTGLDKSYGGETPPAGSVVIRWLEVCNNDPVKTGGQATNTGTLNHIIFAGNTRKMVVYNDIYADELLPGYPHTIIHPKWDEPTLEGTAPRQSALIVPFEGIDIPEDASAVRFEISWNLEDLIEVYDKDLVGTKSDDIFVLKNGWWDEFSIQAVIEGGSVDTWANITGLAQINGTWKGTNNQSETVQQFFGGYYVEGSHSTINLTTNNVLNATVNAGTSTRDYSLKTTRTFFGGNINTVWSDIKTEFEKPEFGWGDFNDNTHSMSKTMGATSESISEATFAGAKINQNGTKLKLAAGTIGSAEIILVKQP
ncbi:hypothetical protein AGMMS49587_00310 [Spirochaetia bacterium]|nr:hypothetical protein AGMMS49587_00310 [Spirochaetia bacterium]